MVTTSKKRLICTVIAVAVLVLTSGGVLLAKAVGLHTGVDGVAVTRDGRLSVVCQGPNSSKAAYAVRPIGENDDVFFENRSVPNDRTLGRYQVEVLFFDVQASDAFAERYPVGKIHTLAGVPEKWHGEVRIRIAYPPDDTMFAVYIGADRPIDVATCVTTALDAAWGGSAEVGRLS